MGGEEANIPLEFSDSAGPVKPAALFNPGQSQILTFKINNSRDVFPHNPESIAFISSFTAVYSKASCTLTVTTNDFIGNTAPQSKKTNCSDLLAFLKDVPWKK
jgi:hypothetical protein